MHLNLIQLLIQMVMYYVNFVLYQQTRVDCKNSFMFRKEATFYIQINLLVLNACTSSKTEELYKESFLGLHTNFQKILQIVEEYTNKSTYFSQFVCFVNWLIVTDINNFFMFWKICQLLYLFAKGIFRLSDLLQYMYSWSRE